MIVGPLGPAFTEMSGSSEMSNFNDPTNPGENKTMARQQTIRLTSLSMQ